MRISHWHHMIYHWWSSLVSHFILLWLRQDLPYCVMELSHAPGRIGFNGDLAIARANAFFRLSKAPVFADASILFSLDHAAHFLHLLLLATARILWTWGIRSPLAWTTLASVSSISSASLASTAAHIRITSSSLSLAHVAAHMWAHRTSLSSAKTFLWHGLKTRPDSNPEHTEHLLLRGIAPQLLQISCF